MNDRVILRIVYNFSCFHLTIFVKCTGTVYTLTFQYCETWSLTLRDERRLRMFENRVMRTFGPRRDEVTGERRKLHN